MEIRIGKPLLCLLCLGAPFAIHGQESLRTSIAACAGLTDETLRIDCYDALAGISADDPEPAADLPEPEGDSARTFPVETQPADASPAEPPGPAPAPPEDEDEELPAAPPEDEKLPAAPPADKELYGFEDRATEDVDRIQSRYAGHFEGWSGDTVFPLENGQVWRQAEAGTLAWSAESPTITIERGWFDTFRLSVEGLNSSVRVERIE